MKSALGKKMENRYNARVPFHVHAVVKIKDQIIDGEVENLSTGGLLFKTTVDMPLNEPVAVKILLYGTSSHLALDITGKVVRKSGDGTAIQFTELDLDSFIHLRNIVSRNAEDEKIIQEYQDLRGRDVSKD
jgi:hypothetical protein